MQPSNADEDAEFEAFCPALVVTGLQKRLASLALAPGRAYVGLNDGGLLVLAPVPSSGTDSVLRGCQHAAQHLLCGACPCLIRALCCCRCC